VLLDGAQIRALLLEVADEIPDGPVHEVVLAGGALLALHGLRGSTVDVDSVRALDGAVRDAVGAVAARRGLGAHWLNDAARPFLPSTVDLAACDVLIEHGRLRVLGLPWRDLFAMKLYSARTRDVEDLRAVWPHCGFVDAAAAVAHFRRAYPDEPEDPYLEEFVAALA
jgi:hypothetical protein